MSLTNIILKGVELRVKIIIIIVSLGLIGRLSAILKVIRVFLLILFVTLIFLYYCVDTLLFFVGKMASPIKAQKVVSLLWHRDRTRALENGDSLLLFVG